MRQSFCLYWHKTSFQLECWLLTRKFYFLHKEDRSKKKNSRFSPSGCPHLKWFGTSSNSSVPIYNVRRLSKNKNLMTSFTWPRWRCSYQFQLWPFIWPSIDCPFYFSKNRTNRIVRVFDHTTRPQTLTIGRNLFFQKHLNRSMIFLGTRSQGPPPFFFQKR